MPENKLNKSGNGILFPIYTEDDREDTLRTLISVSESIDEADGYIINHDETQYMYSDDSSKEIKEIIIRKKYMLIQRIFGIGEMFACGSQKDEIEINYRTLLSTLIIQPLEVNQFV